MVSLKKSMKWDEEVYGLEYDLDLFNIVAVDDFNMGAMENKSLNIFNSRLVLATPDSSSDGDYARIEGVVAHEYFHNWTGNRVTCRDWFQLTLKEGLTVFRDQEFSADMNSRDQEFSADMNSRAVKRIEYAMRLRAVKRIEDAMRLRAVKRIEDAMRLRSAQFSEDAGPMAHPIRPDSYIKMDNFYTVTVYEKGAEIIRLYHTLLGAEGFRRGTDLYFKRHDGQAVTCDDFLAAMSDANGGVDLSGISRWYGQAGTPQLTVSTSYDAAAKTFTINTRQATPPTPGQPNKVPVMIPLKVGLLGPDGKDLPLKLQGSAEQLGTTTVLRVDAETNTFVFEGVPSEPVPSLLRDFSAPVKMVVEGQSDEQLVFLFANDSDEFNRWNAGQRLAMKLMLHLYAAAASANADSAAPAAVAAAADAAGGVSAALVGAFRAVLTAGDIDGSYKAMAVTLPSVSEIVDMVPQADPVLAHQVRHYVNKRIAAALRPELEALVAANDDAPGAPFVFNASASARRAAKNKALGLLSTLGDAGVEADLLRRAPGPPFVFNASASARRAAKNKALGLLSTLGEEADLLRRFRGATNMTDRINALACLADHPGAARDAALAEYYSANKDKPLNMLKWLAVQSGSGAPGNVAAVKELLAHPAFMLSNPNSCYSLFLGFARSAPNFHAADGSGYEFLGDAVLQLNKVNAIVASRVASAFTTYRQYDASRQGLMRAQLSRIAAAEGLCENVFEIVSKSLEQ
ncbi:MAG: hypothetical protein J3K34DRAFT_523265 [Monoraphidium minutum]|nr:MAG: hypothetical protein J3K34DRAFT_523265 [Monoraphidium minutum]